MNMNNAVDIFALLINDGVTQGFRRCAGLAFAVHPLPFNMPLCYLGVVPPSQVLDGAGTGATNDKSIAAALANIAIAHTAVVYADKILFVQQAPGII